MAAPRKLNDGELNVLRLIVKGAAAQGWAPVSAPVVPLVKALPEELVEFESIDNGRGRVRLTEAGANVLAALEWL